MLLRRHKEYAPIVILVVATLLGAVAGVRAHLAMNRHDEPVPSGTKREEVAAMISLPPRIGCEEAFDLALYEESGVELVTWRVGSGGAAVASFASCTNRHVVVKFIPDRIKRSALLKRMERLAVPGSVQTERETAER